MHMSSMEKYLVPATVFEYEMCLHERHHTLTSFPTVCTRKGGGGGDKRKRREKVGGVTHGTNLELAVEEAARESGHC